jgi:ribosomal-protein-alanine N-acetyltransferase
MVRRFLWDDRVIPREETATIVDESVRSFETRGFGLWGMFERRQASLAGFGGYWYFRQPPELELVFGVSPLRWGMGLATEATRAVIRFGLKPFASVKS